MSNNLMKVPTEDKEYLTLEEVQILFPLKKTKIYDLLNAGRIKAIKLDKSTIFLRGSIEKLFNNLPSYKEGLK